MKPVALFQEYSCAEDYQNAGLKFISPMLAKELEEEEKQDACLNSPDYYVEEKFDGTRATLHFCKEFVRVFSRRVSEKTGWLCENSDSVPHIRDLNVSELEGTILDGEMFIPNRPFKDVASTLNCKWDKAVDRQEEIGKIVFHAFDILYYKGIRVEMMPLHRRKVYLQKVIDAVNSQYIEMVDFQTCGKNISTVPYENTHGNLSEVFNNISTKFHAYTYPNFYQEMLSKGGNFHELSPRAFYEYIVATGGEGVIVKPIDGKYLQDKRGWEYSKIKKFLTREVLIMGFTPPTDDYKGKFPTVDKWDYWETVEKDVVDLSDSTPTEREQFKINWYPNECRPVSKFYAKGWVGNIRFGVVITPEEAEKLPKNKKFNIATCNFFYGGEERLVLEVGECSGFDEETRKYLTEHQAEVMGSIIEVKANEIFKDTGKLRHPRFLRFRNDKSPFECTWKEHIS